MLIFASQLALLSPVSLIRVRVRVAALVAMVLEAVALVVVTLAVLGLAIVLSTYIHLLLA